MDQKMRHTRTTEYLLEALIELAGQKSIYKVGVKELCKKAQINRTTFYKHYINMQDFIDQIIEKFVKEMDEYVENENIFDQAITKDPHYIFQRCVEYMSIHSDFLRMMFGPNGSLELKNRIHENWMNQARDVLCSAERVTTNPVDAEIHVCYVSSAMWGLLEFFLQYSNKYTCEYMADQMSVLFREQFLVKDRSNTC